MRAAVLGGLLLAVVGCQAPDPELIPDERLQAELGLTERDRVHTIELRTGIGEVAEPDSLALPSGDFVQFVSTDWLVHEVRFELDSLGADARRFMEVSGQQASPPLLQRDARFVLTFEDAPPGRYPYRLAGNRAAGRGVIVVPPPGGR
jgi:plastocyanin